MEFPCNIKRVFIYKMRVEDDPDPNCHWGVDNCMGKMRDWDYDAVIAVAGFNWEGNKSAVKRIVWVGICPEKKPSENGTLVDFEVCRYFGENGPLIEEWPSVSKRLFPTEGKGARFFIADQKSKEWPEVMELLKKTLALTSSRRGSNNPKNRKAKKRCR